MDMKQTLTRLLLVNGPTGSEGSIREVIADEIARYIDETRTDALGNLIAVKKAAHPGKGRRVMLSAHMDQIGFIVTNVDEHGFLRVHNLGGINRKISLARHVSFNNGVQGVLHYETEDDKAELTMALMYVDIGASTREEALAHVQIGDVCTYHPDVVDMGTRMASPAMDNRAGCAVLIELLKALPACDNEIVAVFSTQEEVGLRGAKAAAFGIDPDMGIALDVTLCGDVPKGPKIAVELGKGPTVKIMDSSLLCSPQVIAEMRAAANAAGVAYQNEVLTAGGTDAAAINLTRAGIPSGVVSIPCRYVHTPIETVQISDMEGAVKLLAEMLK